MLFSAVLQITVLASLPADTVYVMADVSLFSLALKALIHALVARDV